MLDNLKQMQEQGIFKILPSDIDIDSLIYNAKEFEDIDSEFESIQNYIRRLHIELKTRYNVAVSTLLSDFYDKFHYELFDIAFTKDTIENERYTKKLDLGTAGIGTLCMKDTFSYTNDSKSRDNIKFRLEERKLLKLINHYYIKLKATDDFKNDMFYIPFEQIKEIFITTNNKLLKDSFIETCDRLKHKTLYWDLSNTHYNKIKKEKLAVGKNESLIDITILYQPRKHKNGINGEVYTIKGLLCRVNHFMKMRYELKQISNRFPIDFMKSKYTEFIIAEKITYHMNLLNASNEKRMKSLSRNNIRKVTKDRIQSQIKNYYDKKLVDLAKEIYLYQNGTQSSETYLSKITTKENSARTMEELISNVCNVLFVTEKRLGYIGSIYVGNEKVRYLYQDVKNNNSIKVRKVKNVYNAIRSGIDLYAKRGKVKERFLDGNIKIRIEINVN